MSNTQTDTDKGNNPSQPVKTEDVPACNSDDLTDESVWGMEFGSWKDAEVFYNAYAKQVGFSIHKRDVRKSRGGEVVMVKWVCGKQGHRDPKCTRHIVELCKEQHGGFQNMGFTSKDVENAIQALRKNLILGGDANTTLGYLAGRREADPRFVYNYTVSENKQLGIPCRHILNVLKLRKMSAIPSACFSDRWMKQAKVKGSSDVTATSLENMMKYPTRYTLYKVKDVLFEPVRKTQDAMYFFKTPTGMWVPCGPKQVGAIQMTTQDLATTGEAAKV
ncbi:Protein SUPPRESSOR OF K(+) TRANSPORT GROWTH DEFECT 1 [Linum perenne]